MTGDRYEKTTYDKTTYENRFNAYYKCSLLSAL